MQYQYHENGADFLWVDFVKGRLCMDRVGYDPSLSLAEMSSYPEIDSGLFWPETISARDSSGYFSGTARPILKCQFSSVHVHQNRK